MTKVRKIQCFSSVLCSVLKSLFPLFCLVLKLIKWASRFFLFSPRSLHSHRDLPPISNNISATACPCDNHDKRNKSRKLNISEDLMWLRRAVASLKMVLAQSILRFYRSIPRAVFFFFAADAKRGAPLTVHLSSVITCQALSSTELL